MKQAYDAMFTGVLAASAILIAGSLVHREFFAPSVPAARTAAKPELVKHWQDLIPEGRTIGKSSAPVQIVEFMDLECPFCRQLNVAERAVLPRFGDSVAVTFIHLPLSSIHRFARPAAVAAECAASQGRFGAFVDAVYAKQDSLGLRGWTSFASDAGVADTGAFVKCVHHQANMAIIDAGQSLANRFDVTGTPTVIINGWRYAVPPDSAELLRALTAVLHGERPFKG